MMDKRMAVRRLKKILEVLLNYPEWKRLYQNEHFEVEAFSSYSVETERSRDVGARFYYEEPSNKVDRNRSYSIGPWQAGEGEDQREFLGYGDSWAEALANWLELEANSTTGRKHRRFFYGPETRAFLLKELERIERESA